MDIQVFKFGKHAIDIIENSSAAAYNGGKFGSRCRVLLEHDIFGRLGFGTEDLEYTMKAARFTSDFDIFGARFLAVAVHPMCGLDEEDKVANRESKRHRAENFL